MVNEWTADDLPAVFPASYKPWSFDPGRRRDLAAWLNKHHPKPVWREDAEADRDRWRRAHEIVERERDQAREQRDELQAKLDGLRVTYRNLDARANKIVERVAAAGRERDQARDERDKWEEKYLDTDEALHQARTERDDWMVRAENAEWGMESGRRWSNADLEAEVRRRTQCLRDNLNGVTKSRDEWKERAEAAEARTAPAVTREEVAEAISRAWGEDGSVSPHGVLDRVWSLVSGDDPAVLVVRESDVAAVEVRRASDGWYADGAWLARADETAEWVRDRAAAMVVYAARNEAVARAIEAEQATDPLLDKAQEFAALADWELTDREAELLHAVARHVIGQEAKR